MYAYEFVIYINIHIKNRKSIKHVMYIIQYDSVKIGILYIKNLQNYKIQNCNIFEFARISYGTHVIHLYHRVLI